VVAFALRWHFVRGSSLATKKPAWLRALFGDFPVEICEDQSPDSTDCPGKHSSLLILTKACATVSSST
jgi:hypothetical protein